MLVYCNGPATPKFQAAREIDRRASITFAQQLFPKNRLADGGDIDLSNTCPPDGKVHVGVFEGINVIASREFAIDNPSQLDRRFLDVAPYTDVYFHAMHSVVDWCAFAHWRDGELIRSLSLSPDSGVIEDLGERLAFERPYWAGEHPAMDPEEAAEMEYPFSFHPLDLGEEALREWFGYQLEGDVDATLVEPSAVPLVRLSSAKAWWKLW